MAFNEMCLSFKQLSLICVFTFFPYIFIKYFDTVFSNQIFNLMLIENYWSDLYEINSATHFSLLVTVPDC